MASGTTGRPSTGFTGADIRLITEFPARFGDTALTRLDKTFRFNNSIGEVASRFVMQNPGQLAKTLTPHVRVDTPAVTLVNSDDAQALNTVLAQLAALAESATSVYLLARYHSLLPDPHAQAQLRRRWPQLDIEALTFHASKGKEADHVLILGLHQGPIRAFPPTGPATRCNNACCPAPEAFEHAEERRLLYVALTRARHSAWLLSSPVRESVFVTELRREGYPMAQLTLPQAPVMPATPCPRCRTGRLGCNARANTGPTSVVPTPRGATTGNRAATSAAAP